MKFVKLYNLINENNYAYGYAKFWINPDGKIFLSGSSDADHFRLINAEINKDGHLEPMDVYREAFKKNWVRGVIEPTAIGFEADKKSLTQKMIETLKSIILKEKWKMKYYFDLKNGEKFERSKTFNNKENLFKFIQSYQS